MTRGRLPKKGLGDAIMVAKARGTVMCFLQNKETLCDIMIVGNGHLIVVQVRKARRIRGTREEIEREFREPIIELRSFPSSDLILKELWTYSRYGILEVFPYRGYWHCRDWPGRDTAKRIRL
ncbi:MAG: hypothetical protein M0Q91_04720 [Methanoregula sp.]|jgi:hypothetical protein|nr:hypothetical protein [Methanoregula sp.]